MTVKELLITYHKLVPFPWTLRKIKKAGYTPTQMLLQFGMELNKCTDTDSDTAKALIRMLDDLKMFA